jgi:hypothetical protein
MRFEEENIDLALILGNLNIGAFARLREVISSRICRFYIRKLPVKNARKMPLKATLKFIKSREQITIVV